MTITIEVRDRDILGAIFNAAINIGYRDAGIAHR